MERPMAIELQQTYLTVAQVRRVDKLAVQRYKEQPPFHHLTTSRII